MHTALLASCTTFFAYVSVSKNSSLIATPHVYGRKRMQKYTLKTELANICNEKFGI